MHRREENHVKTAYFCTPCVKHVVGRSVCRFGRVSGILWKITAAISADLPIDFSYFLGFLRGNVTSVRSTRMDVFEVAIFCCDPVLCKRAKPNNGKAIRRHILLLFRYSRAFARVL